MKSLTNHPAPDTLWNGPVLTALAEAYVRFGRYMILSAERAGLLDSQNKARTMLMARVLGKRSLPYVPTVMRWGEETEHGFLVPVSERKGVVDGLLRLGSIGGQDTILLANDGCAHEIECESGISVATLPHVRLLDPSDRRDATVAAFPGATVRFVWE